MIKKIGVDIVSNIRMKAYITDEKMISRILSVRELAAFQAFTLDKRKTEYLAGRFTAKEALIKAMGKGNGNLNYTDISVLNEADGTPAIECQSVEGIIHLSISHCDEFTVAMVIIEQDAIN